MAARKRNPRRKAPAPSTLRAAAAQARPAPRGGRPSIIDTIPGCRDDIEATINDQKRLPREKRLALTQLHQMVLDAYPALKAAKYRYNSFWKLVTRDYGFHGSTPQAE